LKIALETDSIEVTEEQVVTKIFKVRLGNEVSRLSVAQFDKLYLEMKKIKEGQFTKDDVAEMIQKASKLGYISYKDMLIPVGFENIGIKKSKSRDGTSIHYYHYFKNRKNDYGYLIKNGSTKSFVRLGNINFSKSSIGRILCISPKGTTFKKSFYVKNRVTINNQTVKAIVDILVLEGYFAIVGNVNAVILSYRVTNKVRELEFEDNIEPLKVQMAPTRNKQVGL